MRTPAAGAGPLQRLSSRGVLLRSARWFWSRRLTGRGRFLLATTLLVALLGMDTRRALAFVLFSLAAPPLLVALPQFLRRTPRLVLSGQMPARLTAGRPVTVPFTVASTSGEAIGPLSVAWSGALPRGLTAECSAAFLDVPEGGAARLRVRIEAARRGRYLLPQLGVARSDPLGLVRGRGQWMPPAVLLAYPRYFTIAEPPLPVGRRYQPGGIPLASTVGESLEFVGTREYRQGDPPRKIDWRSWARLGRPVVKEYQEEYFSRVALVLDTYLPRRPGRARRDRFEAAITVLASLAEHFGRSEDVVDILAAGPDLYEVSTGRSLGALESVLEVLACLDSCPLPPFESIAPHLFERLARLTTIVAVLLDWDERRRAFVERLTALGAGVHVLLVHEGRTALAWPPEGVQAEFRRASPGQVEQWLSAEEPAR